MSGVLSIARDLVRIGSVNPMGRGIGGPAVGEERLTAWLESFLAGIGARCRRQPVAPGRDNLVAELSWPGSGRSVMLEAHQDTVPVDGMTVPPFDAEVRNGRLYGRGACDVKGGMAAILAAMECLAAERPKGAASVIAAFTVDEESGFTGVRRLARELPAGIAFAVVAEPTRLEVVVAHKGLVRWRVRTRGRSCHSARPADGVNAVYRMAPVLAALEEYAATLSTGRSHPLLGRPTLSVGVIRGGTSVNTVPGSCEIEIDRRLLPGEDPVSAVEHCRRFLEARLPGADLEVEPAWISDLALDTPPDSEAARMSLEAVRKVRGRSEPVGVPYGTDASKLAEAGLPSVVLGPGDIVQAHTVDEWIEIAELEHAVEIYVELVKLAG
ncbi:MAG: M20 family metallopeptidase [Spirochaetes bacterium]|nr:M20 family metallopeptidase [Spirochaetota bacterium]